MKKYDFKDILLDFGWKYNKEEFDPQWGRVSALHVYRLYPTKHGVSSGYDIELLDTEYFDGTKVDIEIHLLEDMVHAKRPGSYSETISLLKKITDSFVPVMKLLSTNTLEY